jgi:hypothetical protein
MKYVVRAEDEATKNRKANKNDIVTGYMTSMVDKKYCPVRSFIMYTEALHPTSEISGKLLSSTHFLLMIKRFDMVPAMLGTILLIASCQLNWPKVVDSHKKVTPTIA